MGRILTINNMDVELSKKTQVVVVTYNPDVDLLQKNLQAILGQFKNVLIVDNGSENIKEIEQLIQKNNFGVKLHKLSQNMGIACAQNIGLKKAIEGKLDWLLTMDQDSIIPDNLTIEYQKFLKEYHKIGLLSWTTQNSRLEKQEVFENELFIISSGSLINVEALKKCGGFDEKLFIDNVDIDINIKIRDLKYRTFITNKVNLFHQLGQETTKKTIRGEVYHQHSPLRAYYMTRNSLVLFKRYFFKHPIWAMRLLTICLREGTYLLCYQSNRINNFKILCQAWRDGLFNKLGKYKNSPHWLIKIIKTNK